MAHDAPHLRPAIAADAPALTALALRSKAHWGYDDAFMKACEAELTITPERIAQDTITLAETDEGTLAGMIALGDGPGNGVLELEDMFVEPAMIGTGLGARLMALAVGQAKARGARRIEVDADPNARGFYEHCGYRLIGSSPSASIPGRELPRLALDL